ncbi:cupin domain-containing protein [Pedobacter sp. Hv1]|uniref:cupin domain-containing protein n=1 Tax=Pedobacter sp. Hv1 TaxID=1740090 RepID=UPI00128EA354|nr:cupin domain-containing protein [Pedobacter sp. Hv1]
MNLKTYIESGVLELYVMDLLTETEKVNVERMLAAYPELGNELDKIQVSMEEQAIATAVQAPKHLKKLVLDSIDNLQKEKIMDENDLPLINKFSVHLNWLNFVASFDKPELIDGRYVKVLRQDEQVTQLLIVSETAIEQEVHQEEYESFLILAGECKCTVANEVRLMKAGDFMEIPLYELHEVELLSSQVTAILQHIRV